MLRTRPRPVDFIEPAQPSGADKPPSGAGWVHEIKYDGYRLQASRQGERVRLFTRNGHDWAERFPLIAQTVARLGARSCLIDGEVAVIDERGLAVFDLLRHGARVKTAAALYAFDLLEFNGADLRPEPIEVRKRRLKKLLWRAAPALQLVQHVEDDGAIVYEHACLLGCEGIVSKRLGSRYSSGRTDNWIKVKNPAAPAVKREAEEDWNKPRQGRGR